jgi:hypothetical protein
LSPLDKISFPFGELSPVTPPHHDLYLIQAEIIFDNITISVLLNITPFGSIYSYSNFSYIYSQNKSWAKIPI